MTTIWSDLRSVARSPGSRTRRMCLAVYGCHVLSMKRRMLTFTLQSVQEAEVQGFGSEGRLRSDKTLRFGHLQSLTTAHRLVNACLG